MNQSKPMRMIKWRNLDSGNLVNFSDSLGAAETPLIFTLNENQIKCGIRVTKILNTAPKLPQQHLN